MPFLIEHVIGNYKTEDVKESLTKLHNNIKENKLPTYESWDGNYDGTLIMCRKELPSIQINVQEDIDKEKEKAQTIVNESVDTMNSVLTRKSKSTKLTEVGTRFC